MEFSMEIKRDIVVPCTKQQAKALMVAFSLACSGAFLASQFVMHDHHDPLSDSDQCFYNGYNALNSRFAGSALPVKDEVWDKIVFECVRSTGLPQQVAVDFDPSLNGRDRYLRPLTPTGS